MNEATLSSDSNFTYFKYGDKVVRFRTSRYLERYTKINTWDHGYIEVMAKYSTSDAEVEEYIDLEHILKGLYMDADEFLRPIKEVRISYAGC